MMSVQDELKNQWLNKPLRFGVFNATGAKVDEARVTLERIRQNDCLLRCAIGNAPAAEYAGFNCAHGLDGFRKLLDESDLRLGCNGSRLTFYVARGMPRDTFGLVGLLVEFGAPPFESAGHPQVATLAPCDDVAALATFSGQTQFRAASLAARES